MRLIDADELVQKINKYVEICEIQHITPTIYGIGRAIEKTSTVDLWHYPDKGEYPTEPNICIRYVDRSGDEFIGYTEWYYPSEDEVGYCRCVISVVCNGVPVDPNDIKMWCKLPYPPKEEV